MRDWPGVCVAISLVLGAATAPAAGIESDLRRCAAVLQDRLRLDCFDGLAAGSAAPAFEGVGSAETLPFTVSDGDALSYRSDDVILVLTVLDAEGKVVQNLHLGGQGEARYRFPAAGRYSVQVDASGGWRLQVVQARGAP